MKSLVKIIVGISLVGAATMMYAAPSGSNIPAEAVEIKARMQADHQHVLRLKQSAHKEKDVIRVNCLNDKLVQMLPLMNIVDSWIDQLSGPDSENVFKELTAAGQKVHEQRELADQCADSKLLVSE